jgi:hypothetical protein
MPAIESVLYVFYGPSTNLKVPAETRPRQFGFPMQHLLPDGAGAGAAHAVQLP